MRHGRTNTTAAGYGYAHQKARRDALARLVEGTPCHHCGRGMYRSQPLDLDHAPDRTHYRGLAHAACNRADGARRGNAQRGRTGLPTWRSRAW